MLFLQIGQLLSQLALEACLLGRMEVLPGQLTFSDPLNTVPPEGPMNHLRHWEGPSQPILTDYYFKPYCVSSNHKHFSLFLTFIGWPCFLGVICYFCFCSHYSGRRIQKNIAAIYAKSILPMFSLRSFIVSGLMFRPLTHFEFIFVHGIRECSNFILLHVAVQFSSTTCWKDYLFFIVYSCLLCHRLIDHRCKGLFLGFLSCYTDLYFCFCAITILLWLL